MSKPLSIRSTTKAEADQATSAMAKHLGETQDSLSQIAALSLGGDVAPSYEAAAMAWADYLAATLKRLVGCLPPNK